jgi:catalase
VIFDAGALVLSDEGCAELMGESAADFVSNAFTHLNAIGFTAQT